MGGEDLPDRFLFLDKVSSGWLSCLKCERSRVQIPDWTSISTHLRITQGIGTLDRKMTSFRQSKSIITL